MDGADTSQCLRKQAVSIKSGICEWVQHHVCSSDYRLLYSSVRTLHPCKLGRDVGAEQWSQPVSLLMKQCCKIPNWLLRVAAISQPYHCGFCMWLPIAQSSADCRFYLRIKNALASCWLVPHWFQDSPEMCSVSPTLHSACKNCSICPSDGSEHCRRFTANALPGWLILNFPTASSFSRSWWTW